MKAMRAQAAGCQSPWADRARSVMKIPGAVTILTDPNEYHSLHPKLDEKYETSRCYSGTFANPAIWSNFADFHKRANEASKIAWQAAAAKKPEAFGALIKDLRMRCNACHALNLKTE
jgi:cytochrome c556